MSWFDKLFGDDNGSNDDLLRKNKIDVSLSNQNKIIKTHYCLKIMIFIVDQEVNLDFLYKFLKMNIRKNESYNEHCQEETNGTMSSYNQHDNLDFDSSGKDIDAVAKRIQNTINLRLHSKSNLQIIIIQIITVF